MKTIQARKPRLSKRQKVSSLKIGSESDADQASGTIIDLVPSLLQLKSILVPIDFSKTSLKALEYALPFARQFGAKITLLHVAEQNVYPADGTLAPIAFDGQIIDSLRKRLKTLGSRQVGSELLQQTMV